MSQYDEEIKTLEQKLSQLKALKQVEIAIETHKKEKEVALIKIKDLIKKLEGHIKRSSYYNIEPYKIFSYHTQLEMLNLINETFIDINKRLNKLENK